MEDIEYLWILRWIQKQTSCPLKYWTVFLHVEQMLLLMFVFFLRLMAQAVTA